MIDNCALKREIPISAVAGENRRRPTAREAGRGAAGASCRQRFSYVADRCGIGSKGFFPDTGRWDPYEFSKNRTDRRRPETTSEK